MEIGIRLSDLTNVSEKIRQASELGLKACQLCSFDAACYTDACVREVLESCEKYGVRVSTFWAGWSGPSIWNFTEGPVTLGLLPAAYRRFRIEELKAGSDFAARLGVDQVATHVGFIPENPHDPDFAGLMDAIREVALHCRENGQRFLFETGQETPVALLRTIQIINTGNLGINLDTANTILYGKANPVDMLEILGQYVFDLHIKDGNWPTDGWKLGEETPVGMGKVDFRAIIRQLKALNYQGTLTIEREIEGEKQIEDIVRAKRLLETLLREEGC
jgi:L-ribulose-5-phosphate 3-epimerase